MSCLDTERNIIREVISINPVTVTVTRPTLQTNARGIQYQDYTTFTSVVMSNPVRVCLKDKEGTTALDNGGEYADNRAHYVIADYETTILKYDRITYNGKVYEVQDVEAVLVAGGIRNYQAALRIITDGNV